MTSFASDNHSVKYQAQYWCANVPIDTEEQEEYVKENAGNICSYTTPASDNDVLIRWGHQEEKDRNYDGKHVHVWLAVINRPTSLKKRITKHAAKQQLVSALRMNNWILTDVPYLAACRDRLAYEKYADKTAEVEKEGHWSQGGITNVSYLRKVVSEVGRDLFDIYRRIHVDTNLPLQKIVSQRSGIQAYIDINKQVQTGSIKRQVQLTNKMGVHSFSQRSDIQAYIDINKQVQTGSIKRQVQLTNKMGVHSIVRNIKHHTSIHDNPLTGDFILSIIYLYSVGKRNGTYFLDRGVPGWWLAATPYTI